MAFEPPENFQVFMHDMVLALRALIATDPLTTEQDVDGYYILVSFLKFIISPAPSSRNQRLRWEMYSQEARKGTMAPYPIWLLQTLEDFLQKNRRSLAKLPRSTSKIPRPIFQLSLDDQQDPLSG
jgi:hypothetical protein